MELVLRTAVVYVVLWAVIRATGKRELAEMGPFDLVLLIVVGDVIQQAVTQEDMSLTGAAIVLATMGLLVVTANALIAALRACPSRHRGSPDDRRPRRVGGPGRHASRAATDGGPPGGRPIEGNRRPRQGQMGDPRAERPVLVHHRRSHRW